MPAPVMRPLPTANRQAAALQAPARSNVFGAAPSSGRSGQGTLAVDYFGGTNAITGKYRGPSRAMPTDPRERARIEEARRRTNAALWGGGF